MSQFPPKRFGKQWQPNSEFAAGHAPVPAREGIGMRITQVYVLFRRPPASPGKTLHCFAPVFNYHFSKAD